jgi:8-oxo-dGTP pyrophosphatase MutT (NUDIX family)
LIPREETAGRVQQDVPIVCLRENAAYSNRFVTVFDDDVRFGDGHDGTYVRVVQSGGLPGVVVFPLAGGLAGLVRVYRYPAGCWEWGFPRGLAHGGDPRATASGELLEELGARPRDLEPLGRMHPDSGILASVVHMFAARYDTTVSAPRDTGEVTAVTWIPVAGLAARIAAGDITDGFTLAAVCAATCRGLLDGEPAPGTANCERRR